MKKILALGLTSAMMLSMAGVAMAGVPAGTSATGSPDQVYQGEVAQMDSLNVMYGSVVAIDGSAITVETYDKSETVIFQIGDTTKLVDAGTGAPLAGELAVGDAVAGYYEIMTMSLPALAPAVAILANIPMDMGFPTVAHLGKAYTEDGKTLLTTANGNPVMIDKTTILAPFATRNIIGASDFASGDLVCIWTGEDFSDTPKSGMYMTEAQVAYKVVMLEKFIADEVIIGGANGETEIVISDEAIALRETLENLGYEVGYLDGIITITKGDFVKTIDSTGNPEMTEINNRIFVSEKYLASIVK